jgi:hypothetical protein
MRSHIYALRSWTIKKRADEFFIAPTAQDGTHRWQGPYQTVARATSAIARMLQREFIHRHKRVTAPQPRTPAPIVKGGEHEQDRAP